MDRGERSWTEIASRALSSLVQNPVEVNEGALQRTSANQVRMLCSKDTHGTQGQS